MYLCIYIYKCVCVCVCVCVCICMYVYVNVNMGDVCGSYPVDGACVEQCDCGKLNPCGEYIFDHRWQQRTQQQRACNAVRHAA